LALEQTLQHQCCNTVNILFRNLQRVPATPLNLRFYVPGLLAQRFAAFLKILYVP